MSNNYGTMIDIDNVIVVINKLQLYVDNEEKIKDNIKNLLESFDTCYSSDNTKLLKEKKINIVNGLNAILENKKKCISLLNETVNKYRNLDMNTALEYNSKYDIN